MCTQQENDKTNSRGSSSDSWPFVFWNIGGNAGPIRAGSDIPTAFLFYELNGHIKVISFEQNNAFRRCMTILESFNLSLGSILVHVPFGTALRIDGLYPHLADNKLH